MSLIHREPALVAVSVLATVIAVVSHLLHWNASTSAVVLAVVIALGHVVTATLAKPWEPSVVNGAIIAALALVSNYWLHLSPSLIQTIAIGLTLLLGNLLRVHVSPAVPPAAPPHA